MHCGMMDDVSILRALVDTRAVTNRSAVFQPGTSGSMRTRATA